MMLCILIGFITGILFGVFVLQSKPQHYKYRIKGDYRLYKVNKIVTEEWADGLAKFECIELIDNNEKSLNLE